MIDRRTSILAGLAALLPVGAGAPPQAPVHRFNRPADRWDAIHRREVKAGDEVWIEGDGVYLVCEDARQHLDGRWTFGVCHMVNPDTNQWEPL